MPRGPASRQTITAFKVVYLVIRGHHDALCAGLYEAAGLKSGAYKSMKNGAGFTLFFDRDDNLTLAYTYLGDVRDRGGAHLADAGIRGDCNEHGPGRSSFRDDDQTR